MSKSPPSKKSPQSAKGKDKDLEKFRSDESGTFLTTNQGVKISDDQNSLKAGDRGPTLLEDFIFREKITHFDHERIPERVVHARGAAAHGFFQVYKPLTELTCAKFLGNPDVCTPVFVRFSTVAGSRGSADTARDVRGFAVKFYTEEGIFDLVGNNIPVFFIQDAIKFPDLIHAVKPEPDNEIPQAATAHDTFWDFVSVMPETMHMVMWIMSDRAIPRSFRMMEGFGVHTFRLINSAGIAHFVKFHWKPLLGIHSLVWDEAQLLAGKDADFHRRDLWEAIEGGDYPEWELGVQVIAEKDQHAFNFDLLDATKLIPEEIVPVQRIGKLTLNRNPDNFFAETEQVAFHPGHIVPGIDFTNDPLLQGRLFSYTDTQLSRLGGPNFHELPINRSVCPFHNNQRDGMFRQQINVGKVSYNRNTLADGFPREADSSQGGFVSYPEKMTENKVRVRSESFSDHFSQASLFWNSQADFEKQHIIDAFSFELGKVQPRIREAIVKMLTNVNSQLAENVAINLGIKMQISNKESTAETSPALSMAHTLKNSLRTRQIAIFAAPGINLATVVFFKDSLTAAGAKIKILAPRLGELSSEGTFLTMPSVVFDAVIIPDGPEGINHLQKCPEAINFLREIYRHCKTIGIFTESLSLLESAGIESSQLSKPGIVIGNEKKTISEELINAVKLHRHWNRFQ
jgi:catalase